MANITVSTDVDNLLSAADNAAMRTSMGVDSAATDIATLAALYALTGLVGGERYRLTGEGNTIMRYRGQTGLTESDQDNWINESAGELINTATDASKLLLTGLATGQQVNITEEADRLERFMGGVITDNANWDVLRNTVDLTINNTEGTGPRVFNGVSVGYESVNIGWVAVDELITETSGNSGGGDNWRIISVNAKTPVAAGFRPHPAYYDYYGLYLSHNFPSRAEVLVEIEFV